MWRNFFCIKHQNREKHNCNFDLKKKTKKKLHKIIQILSNLKLKKFNNIYKYNYNYNNDFHLW